MAALDRHFDEASLPPRLRLTALVETGSLEDVLRDVPASSPAHALQQRLLRAYLATENDRAEPDLLPPRMRLTIIVAISGAIWLAIAGAAFLAFAFL